MWWEGKMQQKLAEADLVPLMYKRYVDDINTVSYVAPSGTRYIDDQIILDESCVTRDEAVDHDRRTMELWQCIANSIHPSIQVEVDFPSNHLKNSVPILDVRVWVEKVIDSNVYRVMHEFYMKEVSSKAVIDARSALSWDVNRTVLTQEVLRS